MVGKASNRRFVTTSIGIEVDSIDQLRVLGIENQGVRDSVEIADGVNVVVEDIEEGKGFLEPVTATMVVSFAVGVGAGIVANAIYDAIGAGIRRVSVDGRNIRPKKEQLKQALEAAIKIVEEQEE